MIFQPTGNPELDRLFAERSSEEPIKPDGELQNSGFEVEGDKVLVPAMSPDELAENTPAFGKKLVPVQIPKGIGRDTFMTLLSNAYALYLTEGAYDNEALQRRTGFAPGIISKCLAASEFKRALSLRGVDPSSTGLTRQQELVLLSITDPSDGKTLSQKLKACGVSFATYRAWMKQPVFSNQVRSMTESTLASNEHALVQLERLASSGDLAAIKFKLELNGRYNPGAQQNIDVLAMMSKVLEIISTHVKDPQALSGISEDFKTLAVEAKLIESGS